MAAQLPKGSQVGGNTFGNVRLKIDYAGVCEVDVVSPARYDRVRFDARVTVFSKNERNASRISGKL